MIKFLKPIKETTEDYEAIERGIIAYFRRLIYLPILKELDGNKRLVSNATPGLYEALRTGRVTFYRGVFSGKFNSEISKQLRLLGAKFHRQSGTYRIRTEDLPRDLRQAISASESAFKKRIQKIDEKLAKMLPEEFAGGLNLTKSFERVIWRVNEQFKDSVKGITLAPTLTLHQRKRIASEWAENMQLWIKDFTEKEITNLRKDMQKSVFAGDRFGSAIGAIQESFGVTHRKAKFLARQETMLLMTKFKQTRYEDAGVNWYKWKTVTGSAAHPVRPWHKVHEGKIFRWDNPPQTDDEGNHKNPGQDYNCRCSAIPMVGYREK